VITTTFIYCHSRSDCIIEINHFIDIDPNTFLIDVKTIENAITNKTKAILPVHLFGQCANMEIIMEIARKHNLYVVEDVAQALGSDFYFSDGTKAKAGTIGHIGCTSFFPSKNLAVLVMEERCTPTTKIWLKKFAPLPIME
jgi:dTDP-4-amino-4,6-dideoxygalactose transaminase